MISKEKMLNRDVYRQAADCIRRFENISICTTFRGTEGTLQKDLFRETAPVEPVTDSRGNILARVTSRTEGDLTFLSEPVLPGERLILLGGGHVGFQVAEMAARCGFRVFVCDDREEFANRERFPDAELVLCGSYEDCLRKLDVTAYDYVVIVTRGHVHDGDCLRALFSGTEPAYTGMIGSRRKVSRLFEQLEKEGFDKERMDRVCTPIGLNIGAVTPEEIAVSILAELIAWRRLPEHTFGRLSNASDLMPEVVEFLAENEEPKAVVTIIEAHGSTPRGAGAKMAVNACRETAGTVGGGFAEGELIREALGIIGTGRYKVLTLDLSDGSAAARTGMICGGVMKVLIEDA